jgi:hypothetical protein
VKCARQNNYSEAQFFTNVIQEPIENGASVAANQAVSLSYVERLVLEESRYLNFASSRSTKPLQQLFDV